MSGIETKKCKKCGVVKPLGEFPKRGAGRSAFCSECYYPKSKVCKVCGGEKLLDELVSTSRGDKVYYRKLCKECRSRDRRIKRHGDEGYRARRGVIDRENQQRTCVVCGEMKPFSDFPFKDKKRDVRDSRCRKCKNLEGRLRDHDGVDPGEREVYLIDRESRVRECSVCREVKSFDEFHTANGKPISRCKDCINSLNRMKTHGGVDPGPPENFFINVDAGVRECCRCREVKPFSEFYFRKVGGYASVCKDCVCSEHRKKNHGGKDPGPQKVYYVNEEKEERECSCCGETKSFSEFTLRENGIAVSACNDCRNRLARMKTNNGVDPGPKRVSGIDYDLGVKECLTCDEWKPFSDFKRAPNGVGGYLSKCRECENKECRENPQLRLGSIVRSLVVSEVKRFVDVAKVDRYRDLYKVHGFGCSLPVLIFFFENQFYQNPRDGREMTWENYGRPMDGSEGWEIDHIVPISSFDLTDPSQFVKASHVSNLQPLWQKDNVAKGNRIMTQDEARKAYQGGRV